MRLLVELRLFEAVRRVAVVGHRVLAVLVEEQFVETTGEVVGVLGVLARLFGRVDAVDLGEHLLRRLA
jgi:hypothetical protein